MTLKIAILGGCFPVQEKIKTEQLYHSILKEKLLHEKEIETEFLIYRYDTFRECIEIIKKLNLHEISYVLLHIRPDPYLMASKLYLKFINKELKKERKINLHFIDFDEPDKCIVNVGSKKYSDNFKAFVFSIKKQMMRSLRNVNYIAGFLIGNNYITKRIALKTINDAFYLIENSNAKLIVQGPPMRPRSIMENILLKKLGKFLSKNTPGNIIYINGLYEKDNTGNYIFSKDKIHLNEYGHLLFANLLYKSFTKEI